MTFHSPLWYGENRKQTFLVFWRRKYSWLVLLTRSYRLCDIVVPLFQHFNIKFRHWKLAVLNHHQNVKLRIVAQRLIVSHSLVNNITKVMTFHLSIRSFNTEHAVFPVIVTHLVLYVKRMGLHTDSLPEKWIIIKSFDKNLANLVWCRPQFIPLLLVLNPAVLQSYWTEEKVIAKPAEFVCVCFILSLLCQVDDGIDWSVCWALFQ